MHIHCKTLHISYYDYTLQMYLTMPRHPECPGLWQQCRSMGSEIHSSVMAPCSLPLMRWVNDDDDRWVQTNEGTPNSLEPWSLRTNLSTNMIDHQIWDVQALKIRGSMLRRGFLQWSPLTWRVRRRCSTELSNPEGSPEIIHFEWITIWKWWTITYIFMIFMGKSRRKCGGVHFLKRNHPAKKGDPRQAMETSS